MLRRTLLVISLFILAACSGEGPEAPAAPTASGDQAGSAPSWREQRMALGRDTYEAACASCHAGGEQDAPVTGNRDDWSGRSDMWQAVLFNHAKSGYLDMPGKGGQADLSDEAVEAATEYMLDQTFPELPRD
jgi:cytochrome c5